LALIGVDLSLQWFVGGIQPLIRDVGFSCTHSTTASVEVFSPQGWKPGSNISALAGSVAITASAGTANGIRVTSAPRSSLSFLRALTRIDSLIDLRLHPADADRMQVGDAVPAVLSDDHELWPEVGDGVTG
jgi:hypothetical protein